MNAAYAMKVIEETHHAWQLLVTGEKDRMPEPDGMADGEHPHTDYLTPLTCDQPASPHRRC